MAVIQKLRNSGWVAVAIVVALVLFIVGDWLTGRNGSTTTDEDRDVIAEFGGEKLRESELIDISNQLVGVYRSQNPEFQLDEKTSNQIISESWRDLIETTIWDKEIENSGIYLSDFDKAAMYSPEHPNEIVSNMPLFQTNGKYDVNKVEEARQNAKVNKDYKALLGFFIEKFNGSELRNRYSLYFAKSQVFTTKVEEKYNFVKAQKSITGKMVVTKIADVADKDVTITDDDLQEYLNEHQSKYKIKQNKRSVKYVIFPITASTRDTLDTRDQAVRFAESIGRQATPDTTGAIGFVRRSDLEKVEDAIVKDSLWDATVGDVIGPVYDKGIYSVYQKVFEAEDTTPVVKVAHILIPFNGSLPNGESITDTAMANAKANEVMGMIMQGQSFEDLAPKYSTDQGSSANGGSYGWVNPATENYVPEYKEFCMTAKSGQVGIVKTQFGFHVMKMVEGPDYKKMKFVMQSYEVLPGSETIEIVSTASRKFKNQVNPEKPETFDDASTKMSLVPRVETDFTEDQTYLGGIKEISSMQSIKFWLFNAERTMNEVSEIFAFPNMHVVVKVENVKNEGDATIEMVRSDIEPIVRKLKKGKIAAEKLAAAIKSEADVEAAAKELKADIVNLDGFRANQAMVPQLGREPKLIGAAFGVTPGIVSKPIIGDNSVGIVVGMKKGEAIEVPASIYNTPVETNVEAEVNMMFNRIQGAIRGAGNLKDYRYKFPWFKG